MSKEREGCEVIIVGSLVQVEEAHLITHSLEISLALEVVPHCCCLSSMHTVLPDSNESLRDRMWLEISDYEFQTRASRKNMQLEILPGTTKPRRELTG